IVGGGHGCGGRLQGRYSVVCGVAVALMLPHAVRWNRAASGDRYDDLHSGDLERHLRDLAELAGLPASLREAGIPAAALPRLADEAAAQWTGRFNPRPFDAAGAMEIYQWAMG